MWGLLAYGCTPSELHSLTWGGEYESNVVVRLERTREAGKGMILVEITSAQRSMIQNMAVLQMEAMRQADPNSWTTYAYAELENLAYALFVNCAE